MKLKTFVQISLFCLTGLSNMPAVAETSDSKLYSTLGQFDVPVGRWEMGVEEGKPALMVRGDKWEGKPVAESSAVFNQMFQGLSESFLDSIKAFMYFPLALVKDAEFQEGTLTIQAKPISGETDQAAGIAFGMANPGSYWVLRFNALENNVMLFEWVKGRRFPRHNHRIPVMSDRWYTLEAKVQGKKLEATLDGQLLFTYDLGRPVKGKFGIWSKADSVSAFRSLTYTPIMALQNKR